MAPLLFYMKMRRKGSFVIQSMQKILNLANLASSAKMCAVAGVVLVRFVPPYSLHLRYRHGGRASVLQSNYEDTR